MIKIKASCRLEWLVVLMAAVISGCATTKYIEPNGPSVAYVDFSNQTSEKMYVHFFNVAQECRGLRSGGVVGPASSRTVKVLSNEEVAFGTHVNLHSTATGLFAGLGGAIGAIAAIATANSNTGCKPRISFVPKEGQSYTFQMYTRDGDCNFQLLSGSTSNPNASKVDSVEFKQHKANTPMSEAGPFCEK